MVSSRTAVERIRWSSAAVAICRYAAPLCNAVRRRRRPLTLSSIAHLLPIASSLWSTSLNY